MKSLICPGITRRLGVSNADGGKAYRQQNEVLPPLPLPLKN
ncbi:hypothetical protein AvCA_25590 [Azotobacter vinelandii CA]|uniref:Uncharacterized protein n=2 Tax=Azotobacter vinelandii TaxID=354 RepID=C1DIQ8_AZOVD|nr:hypothetical protein Avin_25590 [Azotobacter vinelandii DJ]AGK14922.1 hypothetical protein AvCA_25590 [Azotobacter vinelandii CA]AGK20704.1 hypothetical protein AvCA6_25590 [Azotobacter vinelandii CA6]